MPYLSRRKLQKIKKFFGKQNAATIPIEAGFRHTAKDICTSELKKEQRKHLENLMNSRGLVCSSSPWRRPKPIDSSRSKVSVFRQRQIRNENRILLTKLSRVSLQSSPPPKNKFTLLSQSLSNIVALNRQRKYQGINKENKSIYTRIVTASPSMPQKKQWLKYIDSQNKYRINAMKKIKKQDFTFLAESQMKSINHSVLSSATSKVGKKESPFHLPTTLLSSNPA